MTPGAEARRLRRQLATLARPAADFDAQRYFRGPGTLGFFNIRTAVVRRMGRDCAAGHPEWSLRDAILFAEPLLRDPHLEAKNLALETVARFKRQFTPRLLGICKRWLRDNRSNNWATTDLMCGAVLGPLLVRFPELIPAMHVWSRDPNIWVRRASIVALIAPLRRGLAMDDVYAIAERLHPSPEDLIHKAVGWLLRCAGSHDRPRLERYLRARGATIPRTTVRYAIEHFPPAERKKLLRATKAGVAGRTGETGSRM